MSQENVEFVRSFYAMHNRGGAEFWDLLPPDFIFDLSQRPIDPVTLSRDQTRAEYDRLRHEIFGEGYPHWEPVELIDAGDKVLVRTRSSGRGKSGGVLSGHLWGAWTFRDGKPVEWRDLGSNRAAALEAVGLRG